MTPRYILENEVKINTKPEQVLSLGLEIYNNETFDKFPVMNYIKDRFINENKTIKKRDVIELFDRNDIYTAIVCTMIWGGINATRAKNKEDTFFYKFLNYPKNILLENIITLNSYLENEDFIGAFEFFQKDAKIEGVGSAYFTKIFYFLGQSNTRINIKPLIFDKWTENAYLALLLQNGEFDKVKKFYKGVKLKFSKQPDSVQINDKFYSACYQSYVEDFNKWSKVINSDSTKLEEYVFGDDLRKNKSNLNPRIQLWNIILKNLNHIL
ncbi:MULTISPECIES: 8-oxoguanine DNA glycosylase OGG fold protein [Flavobacteriaceae]|uniref:Uncharacterized protein n=2 Tax=Flavobacteriaceae TaxID=49546 RepID=A0A4Y8ASM9_9FLAO|nr:MULTISPECIES: hypothetical protein [Flavobacteriaceae]TEW73829.1 hypothetical protein E2488_10135 [Gramella jeungdoensis]GGK37949.1 hypothetical protein GCM10007963_02590 [Lutibacter litoralis]